MTARDKVDARAVFNQASRFHYAGALLRIEHQAVTAPTIEPYVVISSFCSELYMKCMYAIETRGSRISGHDLRKLFNALSPQSQSELEREWAVVSGAYNNAFEQSGDAFRLPTDLVGQLDASGRMFEQMRYFYEGGEFAKHWYLSPLPDMLRTLILKRHPDWAEDADLMPGVHAPHKDEDGASRPLGHWSFIMYGILPGR